MTSLFPPWPLFSAFVLASLVLAVTPGPGVFYIVTRSIVQGRRSGLVSVAGVALGNLGNALAASVGLAALFAVSSLAFTIVKYAGALYLVYLGVQMLRTPPPSCRRPRRQRRRSGASSATALSSPCSTPRPRSSLPRSCRSS
ncbi:MAG: LysE family translocator [Candidatus Accumulibacter propinquus]|jgi:threonine/homoserine/homoserine lactone efflux protein|uniref:LysE family translocator n=1 Tax=Candidatus Accumulibacter propinquus TaxID=2954380 RepID=UPI002FC27635